MNSNKPIPQYIIYESLQKQEQNNISKMTMDEDSQEQYQDQSGLITFANLEKEKKKQSKLVPATDQEKYLWTMSGLNLNGKCSNNNCEGKNGSWYSLGYGVFSINQAKTQGICRQCGSKIKAITVVTVGFTRAIVQFKGVIYRNESQVDFKQTYEERKGQLIFFKGEQGGSLENWFYLNANCKKLQQK